MDAELEDRLPKGLLSGGNPYQSALIFGLISTIRAESALIRANPGLL